MRTAEAMPLERPAPGCGAGAGGAVAGGAVAGSPLLGVPASAPRRRGAARPVPERAPELAHLTLPGLRSYRADLSAEENRVSYWRRLVQARLDVLDARGGRADLGRLPAVLSDPRGASRRQALAAAAPSDEVPPLPDLAELWASHPAPGDDVARDALVVRLAAAERELSDYRAALHRRIDRATADLIARYHQDPLACLVALPLRR